METNNKLREALETLVDLVEAWQDHLPSAIREGELAKAIKKAEAALSAPPRNCDRPECATTKAAADVWRKEDGGKTAYHEWLLATATEKEGGNNADK